MNDANPAAIVTGLAILGLAAAFMFEALDVWEVRGVIALSAMVIGLGLAMLAGALWRADRHEG